MGSAFCFSKSCAYTINWISKGTLFFFFKLYIIVLVLPNKNKESFQTAWVIGKIARFSFVLCSVPTHESLFPDIIKCMGRRESIHNYYKEAVQNASSNYGYCTFLHEIALFSY